MNKLTVSVLILTLLVVVGGSVFFGDNDTKSESRSSQSVEIINHEYYWGEGCPHCENIEEFLQTWDKREEIVIDKKEIYRNKSNANLMTQRAKSCNLNINQLGVPFLVTPAGECLSGDVPIIEYLKSLYGAN